MVSHFIGGMSKTDERDVGEGVIQLARQQNMGRRDLTPPTDDELTELELMPKVQKVTRGLKRTYAVDNFEIATPAARGKYEQQTFEEYEPATETDLESIVVGDVELLEDDPTPKKKQKKIVVREAVGASQQQPEPC
jgi:hypothetical protein